MAPAYFILAMFAGISGLYVLLNWCKTRTHAAVIGYAFGFGYFLIGLYWIGNALLVEGYGYAWAWPFAVIGLPLFLAIFPTLACVISFSGLSRISGFLAFAASMTLFEWLRGNILSGFPWNLYGYAWGFSLPVSQILFVTGIYFLTFISILWAAIPAFAFINFQKSRKRQAILVICLGAISFISIYSYGFSRLYKNPTKYNDDVIIKIVQPNISQADKWKAGKILSNFQKTLLLSYPTAKSKRNEAKKTYIIWPETAITNNLLENKSVKRALGAMIRSHGDKAYLLTGFLDERGGENDGDVDYYNSIAIIDSDVSVLQTYDKVHLVPFGEYIPFKDIIPFNPINSFSGFSSGTKSNVITSTDGINFASQICYESIFPDMTINENAKSDLSAIVNVTNDAWYGVSSEPYQHLDHARMRAIENGLPMVRASGSGISAIIDPFGRVVKKINFLNEGSIESSLPLQSPDYRPQFVVNRNFKKMLFFIMLAALFTIKLWRENKEK